MRTGQSKIRKVALASQTILGTSFSTWKMARSACRNAANQKWSELSGLLHILRARQPKWILEIGVHSGGTLALWAEVAQPNAHLIGLDVEIPGNTEERIREKLQRGQSVHLIRADSHADSSKEAVITITQQNKLDFLFIDGDHTYGGVKNDWITYSALVRPGGLVAFHDIIQDHGSRFGLYTNHDAGGVYQLWAELKPHLPHQEFVEDSAQNGYGLGVVTL